jgi:hypothetical protein
MLSASGNRAKITASISLPWQRPANQFAGAGQEGEVRNPVLLFGLGFKPFEGAPMHALGLLPDRIADATLIAELPP